MEHGWQKTERGSCKRETRQDGTLVKQHPLTHRYRYPTPTLATISNKTCNKLTWNNNSTIQSNLPLGTAPRTSPSHHPHLRYHRILLASPLPAH
jgi:hypothetical protein